jgi:hypothetical protein
MSSIDLFRSSQSDMTSNTSKSSSKQRKSTTFLLPPVDQQCSETCDSIGELSYSNSSNSMRRRLSKLKLVKELSSSSNRLANSKSTSLNKAKDSNGKAQSTKGKQDEQEELLFARLNTPKVFNYFTSNSSSTNNFNYSQRHQQPAPRVSFDLESSSSRKNSNMTLPKLALVSKENLLTHHSNWLSSESPSSVTSPSNESSSKTKVSSRNSKNLFFPLLIHNSSSSSLSSTSKLSDSNQNELTNKGFYFMQSMSFINTNKQIL